jgi:hypothetical protein
MNRPQKREGFVIDDARVPPESADAEQEQGEKQQEQAEILEEWPITVRLLHRPIRNNKGEEVRELSFREPTGGDINRYGNPVRINQEGDVVIDERKMTLIMAALSGILSPLLERMDPRDWNSCAYRLRNFFLPDPAAW